MAIKEIDETGKRINRSNRWGAKVRLFVLHTQEGVGTARSLADYCARAEVSYHYISDNETCIDMVDTDYASWSALTANPYTINFCFAGSRASMSRKEWLDRFSDAIDYAAKLFVQDGKKYGVPIKTVSWDELRAGAAGGTDHWGITMGLGIGTHTDCGANFPWDYYQACIRKHLAGPAPAPVVVPPSAIDEQYHHTPWLGAKRVELPCPDGRGRFAEFDNGMIYWTPTTGARPIPALLVEAYRDLGWERGPLGYPIAYHTVLREGDVQAFEGGTLYRKYGKPGFFVRGMIGARWARLGFEESTFGWPTSNEVIREDGSVVQSFERGSMVWSPDGVTALQPVDGPDILVPDVH